MSFSEGYKIKNGKNLFFEKNKDKKSKNFPKSYPNGMIPFIFISIFFIITISCVFGIGFSQYSDIFSNKKVWTNSLICVSILPFLLNILWLIGRTGFSDILSFSLMKVSRNIKMSKLSEKMHFYASDPAINDVNNLNDYKEYAKIRKKKSTKWFYISLLTYSIIFITLLVVSLIVQFN